MTTQQKPVKKFGPMGLGEYPENGYEECATRGPITDLRDIAYLPKGASVNMAAKMEPGGHVDDFTIVDSGSIGRQSIISGEGQILAAPATLFFEALMRVHALVAEPQAAILVEEHFHRPGTGVKNPVADNRLVATQSFHCIYLLNDLSRCFITHGKALSITGH